MDLSNDFIRRELDEITRHHDVAMRMQSEVLSRMVETDELSGDDKDELVSGGLGRRRFLRFGGVAVATSAIFAACGSSSKTRSVTTSTTSPPSTSVGTPATDINALRTASSLEALAVDTYQKALHTGLMTTPTTVAVANNFLQQHQQHANAFEAATTRAGGQPYTRPNPVVSAQAIAPALAKVKTENDLVVLAYMLESAASQTYQSAIGQMSKPTYNSALASVLGVESRHQALLGLMLSNTTTYPSYPTDGFQSEDNAVKIGVGVSS